MHRLKLIEFYFHVGLQYDDIAFALATKHNVRISVRQLKRILQKLQLDRKKSYTNINTVIDFVDNQLTTSGQMHGYRWMHQKCISNGLKVKKEDIRIILKTMDPEGLSLRRRHRLKRRHYFSKGPNFCWHLDSYDKLKPYGLCINGCIDGYSRKLLWLKVWKTSSDPRVIAKYYIDAVVEHGGCPSLIRGDLGTENTRVAIMQQFFRRTVEGGRKAFVKGASTANTRIESWWGILRRQCCQIWIEELKSLRDVGFFSGDTLDKNLIQFCFMKLLQDELDEVLFVWNAHKIRSNKDSSASGRPLALYLLPALQGKQDYLCTVPDEEIEVCRIECAEMEEYPCEEEVFELCSMYMDENSLNPPADIVEARYLYINLHNWLSRLLERRPV